MDNKEKPFSAMVIISYFVASPKFLAEFDCTCFSPKVPTKENGTLDVVQPRLEVGIERKLSTERSVPTFCFLALFYLLDTLPCNCILNKLKLYEKFFLIRGRFLVLKRVSVVLGRVATLPLRNGVNIVELGNEKQDSS